MTEERRAQLAAADPSFIPGGNNQGRRRPSGIRKSKALGMAELEYQAPTHHAPSSLRPMDRFNEKEAQAAYREMLMGICNQERMKRVIESALGGAERGDA